MRAFGKSAGGDRPYGYTEKSRCDQARSSKDPAPSAVRKSIARAITAEAKGCSTKNDTNQHQRKRNVQIGHDHGEGRRKAGKHDYDDQNEPDMIRFPNWSDRVGDKLPLFNLSRPTREKVPYAAAVVRTAGQNVDGKRDQQHARDKEKRYITH